MLWISKKKYCKIPWIASPFFQTSVGFQIFLFQQFQLCTPNDILYMYTRLHSSVKPPVSLHKPNLLTWLTGQKNLNPITVWKGSCYKEFCRDMHQIKQVEWDWIRNEFGQLPDVLSWYLSGDHLDSIAFPLVLISSSLASSVIMIWKNHLYSNRPFILTGYTSLHPIQGSK